MPSLLQALRARLSRVAPPSRPPSAECLLLLAGAWLALALNQAFLRAALAGHAAGQAATWGYALALVLGVAALHLLLLAPLATRWTLKPLLALSFTVAATASYYMQHYGVTLDPGMLRNVLRTDRREAQELLAPGLALHLLFYAGLPGLLLWRLPLAPRSWAQAARARLALLAACALVLVGALLSQYQALAPLLRNHKAVRYLVTPANVLWSLAVVVGADARAAQAPRQAIGLDARPGPSWSAARRPRLLVLVVGETVRSANWGLSGYARQTTPELAALAAAEPAALVNFSHAQACGTNTETALPCMLAPVGRRAYDEARIRSQESLLHLLARAGVGVSWRDNQSGCKGVCTGLPTQYMQDTAPPQLCPEGRCLDEALLHGLPQVLRRAQGTQLLVLHMLGNHGPAYFRRHPPGFARFLPECRSDDLRQCTPQAIVNAYDNTLLYTDHLLAQLIGQLQAAQGRLDSALVYVSDHGESLGEHGLYLHGLPWAIAPAVQKQVPLLLWFSPGFAAAPALDLACLQRRARRSAAHDHLFHTLLGLLDVRSALYEPAWDLTRPCRPAAATAP